ncbi:hypothetical protein DPMN_129129 [Dreissena polymorpha]|uniref:Uncharacterized protein n=1 Tax=Dreissena polymorpha TaxID=45954 RepID=A0A9D4H0N3_DREPO|nr:hypothetical protein DPMN_129129 [Dreissena polymorpha]
MSCVDLEGRHATINLALSGFRASVISCVERLLRVVSCVERISCVDLRVLRSTCDTCAIFARYSLECHIVRRENVARRIVRRENVACRPRNFEVDRRHSRDISNRMSRVVSCVERMSSVALEGRHTTFKRYSLVARYDARQFSRQSRFSAIFFSKTQRDMRHSNLDCRMIFARRIERRENVA